MGYAIMRLQKVKTFGQVDARMKHNHRDYKTAFKSERQNPKIIVNANNQLKYEDFIKQNIDKKVRKNAVVAVEIVTSFSPESPPADLKLWVGENIKWVSDNFGGVSNIYDVAFHADESTGHLHFIVAPIFEGKLNCFHFINGRGDLSKLQTSYAEQMAKFGLQRGVEREKTNSFHQDFKTFRAKEVERIQQLEAVEREKVMTKIHGELGITPRFKEDLYYDR